MSVYIEIAVAVVSLFMTFIMSWAAVRELVDDARTVRWRKTRSDSSEQQMRRLAWVVGIVSIGFVAVGFCALVLFFFDRVIGLLFQPSSTDSSPVELALDPPENGGAEPTNAALRRDCPRIEDVECSRRAKVRDDCTIPAGFDGLPIEVYCDYLELQELKR